MCFKCGGNHLWVDCQAGRYSSYGSSFEHSHFVSSPYRYEDSYGYNSDSGWDEYPYYDWNESEVRQPPQEENGSLEELMYKFINKVEEKFIQDDEATNNLTMQVNQLVNRLSSLHCDGEYMEELPCENEHTQDYEHL